MVSVIAHRGASAYEFENSRAAFRTALELGADGVELDVHATADGVLLVHHDPVVGNLPIGNTVYGDIREYRLENGETIPRLTDVLLLLGEAVDVYVEVKSLPSAYDTRLLAALADGPAPARYHVHSFDHRIVKRLKDLQPSLSVGVLSVSYPVDPVAQVEAAGADTLWQNQGMVDAELVRTLAPRGISVLAWTVDDAARITELAELRVRGICTNRPDLARDVLGRPRFL